MYDFSGYPGVESFHPFTGSFVIPDTAPAPKMSSAFSIIPLKNISLEGLKSK